MAETRSITIFERYNELPAGDYGLFEMYCDEVNCDCRRVIINVISNLSNKSVAVIAYGWESHNFYARRLNIDTRSNKLTEYDLDMLAELKGPCLNSMSPQSNYATDVLKLVSEHALSDIAYVDRLKRHYKLFKEKLIDQKQNKAGRNDPCPCGSGKKYKKCCLGRI